MNFIVEPKFMEAIADLQLREEQLRRLEHQPSGKISASMMGTPVLDCVLKLLGVPDKKADVYSLGKFMRGHQAEEWLVSSLARIKAYSELVPQYKVSYRNGIGFVDLMEINGSEDQQEMVPHEIKSVTGKAFKYINEPWKTDSAGRRHKSVPEPNLGHIYQGTYYALAVGSSYFYLHYVAADDLRLLSFYVAVDGYKAHVEHHIDLIEDALKNGYLPAYEGFLHWHGMRDYAAYPEFVGLDGMQAELLLEKKYSDAYIKLKGVKHG